MKKDEIANEEENKNGNKNANEEGAERALSSGLWLTRTSLLRLLSIMDGIINSPESLFIHPILVRRSRCSYSGRFECSVGKILGSLKRYIVSFSDVLYWTDSPAGQVIRDT